MEQSFGRGAPISSADLSQARWNPLELFQARMRSSQTSSWTSNFEESSPAAGDRDLPDRRCMLPRHREDLWMCLALA